MFLSYSISSCIHSRRKNWLRKPRRRHRNFILTRETRQCASSACFSWVQIDENRSEVIGSWNWLRLLGSWNLLTYKQRCTSALLDIRLSVTKIVYGATQCCPDWKLGHGFKLQKVFLCHLLLAFLWNIYSHKVPLPSNYTPGSCFPGHLEFSVLDLGYHLVAKINRSVDP